jgi:hypothetical protein
MYLPGTGIVKVEHVGKQLARGPTAAPWALWGFRFVVLHSSFALDSGIRIFVIRHPRQDSSNPLKAHRILLATNRARPPQ